MGRTITYRYRVEYAEVGSVFNQRMVWDVKRNGSPTRGNLEQWRKDMNASFREGGINHHITQSCGRLVHIWKARIVRQSDSVVVAETQMPMFEVV